MCNLETEWSNQLSLETKRKITKRLSEIITDGLIEISNNKIKVKEVFKAIYLSLLKNSNQINNHLIVYLLNLIIILIPQ